MTKIELFLELAQPNNLGISRWVNVNEFVGKYESLKLGNGGSWCRKSSILNKKYIVEFDKTITNSNRIDAIKLSGFNQQPSFNQYIHPDIRTQLKNKKCAFLNIKGFSENTSIEIDHKDGQKNDLRLNDLAKQKLEDFQPVCRTINLIKRQKCKKCKTSNIRPLPPEGYPYNYVFGTEKLNESGCKGCFWYDPIEFRKQSFKQNTNK